MQGRRPAERSDLSSFKDGWDQYDFANLVAGDNGWSALYDDNVESVEDLEAQEKEQFALEIIGRDEFADHVLGYAYYREVRYPATGFGGVIDRLTPYRHQEETPAVSKAVHAVIDGLEEMQFLKSNVTNGTFYIGQHFPRERFPGLEGFEETAQQFIRHCGGEALGRIIVLECVEEPESPYHFWAGVRKIAEMEAEEILTHSAGYFALQQTTSKWEDDLLGAIESDVAAPSVPPENLETKIRRLRGEYGPARTQKPIQRGRGWH